MTGATNRSLALQVATEFCGGEVDDETRLKMGVSDILLTGEVSLLHHFLPMFDRHDDDADRCCDSLLYT